MAQGYNQKEGIDYDETFALVARLESYQIVTCLCLLHGFQIVSNGCQECISKLYN